MEVQQPGLCAYQSLHHRTIFVDVQRRLKVFGKCSFIKKKEEKKRKKKVSNSKKIYIHRCPCRSHYPSLCLCRCLVVYVPHVHCLHAARIMKCLQGSKVSPCWRQSVLQKTATALTWGLEELDVAPQPRLGGTEKTGAQHLIITKPVPSLDFHSGQTRDTETEWGFIYISLQETNTIGRHGANRTFNIHIQC